MLETIDEELGPTTIYVCGPMTHYPEFNRANFVRVAADYRADGYTVVSPVELDADEGVDYQVPVEDHAYDDKYRKFLLRDLVAILENDVKAFIVLEGWDTSKGASVEVRLARALDIPVYDEDGLRVKEPSKFKQPTEESILEEAERIIHGARQDQYGHPIEDFARTAGAINAYFGTSFEARDIPVIMVLVKLSRIIQTPTKRDSWVDVCGYAGTAEMVAEREGRPLE